MICLGIESTAHTFGVGIVERADGHWRFLANERSMYRPPAGWGITPVEAKKHHLEVKERLLAAALGKAGLKLADIDLFAVAHGPGLAPCLSVGIGLAQRLSQETGKRLVGVNHPIAHIEIGRATTGLADPTIVYVSGANTQILAYSGGRYRVFGETMDIGLGNGLDKFGRETGLNFPAGPAIEKLALKGNYVKLPYAVKGMDVSFSGILTAALGLLKKGARLEDVCFSLQETWFAMLTEVSERAMAHTGKEQAILIGGVAANKRLCEMMGIMCKERDGKFAAVPNEYAGDNGAMIALTGLLITEDGAGTGTERVEMRPRERADDVEVFWRR